MRFEVFVVLSSAADLGLISYDACSGVLGFVGALRVHEHFIHSQILIT